MVDTGFGGPPTAEQMKEWREQAIKEGRLEDARRMGGPPSRTKPNKVYATLEEALTRFRFMPPQVPGNLFIADYIARKSLKRAPLPNGELGPDGSGQGWTWRFDPFLWGKLNREAMGAYDTSNIAPLAHIHGDRSNIMRRRMGGPSMPQTNNPIPETTPQIVIPDSEHHIMVDQPLALVAAIRAVLATWPS
jgi:pimeloyl-ACP methyl ester carboxylesterase